MWRSQRYSTATRGDLSAIRDTLGCEVLEVLGRLDGSLEGPVLLVRMKLWRAIEDLAGLADHLHGLVAELHMVPECKIVQEVPEDLVGGRAARTTLMHQDHQVPPCHIVELEEHCDVLPQLEGLFVGTSLNDRPSVRGVLEDLTAELPLEERVARMPDVLEHPEAGLGDTLEVLVVAPTIISRLLRNLSFSSATHALA